MIPKITKIMDIANPFVMKPSGGQQGIVLKTNQGKRNDRLQSMKSFALYVKTDPSDFL
jgi:hypothetical protein